MTKIKLDCWRHLFSSLFEGFEGFPFDNPIQSNHEWIQFWLLNMCQTWSESTSGAHCSQIYHLSLLNHTQWKCDFFQPNGFAWHGSICLDRSEHFNPISDSSRTLFERELLVFFSVTNYTSCLLHYNHECKCNKKCTNVRLLTIF